MSVAPFSLFEAFGVELEYMIVDSETLDVRPVCDELLKSVAGNYVSDVERGVLAWSNELALHVVEIKTNGPVPALKRLAETFQQEVVEIETRLESLGACLLPTAMHPWMDPHREMRLWPHECSPIYDAYHRIFDCQGHGWANLQSAHLNYSFADDRDFARLHAAVRLVLPLLPTLAASSPISDGRITGLADTRLDVYRTNSVRIPEVAGHIIPESVSSRAEYEQTILAPMYRAIAPYDPEKLLQDEFLNSRGAIARFGRGSIEIRLLDVQECPANDLAIAEVVTALLYALTRARWTSLAIQQEMPVESLVEMLARSTAEGEQAVFTDSRFLQNFGIRETSLTARDFWQRLIPELNLDPATRVRIERLVEMGTLSTRLRQSLSESPSRVELLNVYRRLANCLRSGETFVPERDAA